MRSKGFTAIELIIVCLIIGLVAAIAIPNYRSSQDRAREGRVKANMHVFQLAAEDFRVQSDSRYADRAAEVGPYLADNFPNPFDRTRGENGAWEDRALMSAQPSRTPGIVSYADSAQGADYRIKGYGRRRTLTLVLGGTLPDYGPHESDGIEERRGGGGESTPGTPIVAPVVDPFTEGQPDFSPNE